MDKAVQMLLDCSSAVYTKESDLTQVIGPLSVVQGSSKLKLIPDPRHVDQCLAKFKFKLDDVQVSRRAL